MLRDWRFGGLLVVNVILALTLSSRSSEAAQAYCGPCYKHLGGDEVEHAGDIHEWASPYWEEDPGTDAVHAALEDGSCFTGPHYHVCCEPGGGQVE